MKKNKDQIRVTDVLNGYRENLFRPFFKEGEKRLVIKKGALSDKGSQRVDAVCLDGDYAAFRDASFASDAAAINSLLDRTTENGRIFLADYNRTGLKFFAGAQEAYLGGYFKGLEGYTRSGKKLTYSKARWERILKDIPGIRYTFYYPYPDHEFPVALYSDDFLPHTGDCNINRIAAGEKQLALFDEERVFNSLIEDGLFPLFANSFLIVIEREKAPVSERLIYAKFSSHRREAFSLYTSVYEKPDGTRRVEKAPEKEGAAAHIDTILGAQNTLRKLYDEERLKINPVRKDGASLQIAYTEGLTYDKHVDSVLLGKGPKAAERVIDGMIDLVCPRELFVPFRRTKLFEKIFGKGVEDLSLLDGTDALPAADVDVIMENIVCTKDGYELIDYEWTFDFPVPVKYLVFRILHYYVNTSSTRLSRFGGRLMEKYGIDGKLLKLFYAMEESFQNYISGDEPSFHELAELTEKNRITVIGEGGVVEDETEKAASSSLFEKEYMLSKKEAFIREDFAWDPVFTVIVFGEERRGFLRDQIYEKLDVRFVSDAAEVPEALRTAKGEYTAFLGAADSADPAAFYEIVRALNRRQEAGKAAPSYIYTDEAFTDAQGKEIEEAFCKPDYSPDTLLSFFYTHGLGAFKTSFLKKLGDPDPDLFAEGGPDAALYDLVLRAAERLDRKAVCHVPMVLLHSRIDPSFDKKIQKRIVAEALKRRGIAAKVKKAERGSGILPSSQIVYGIKGSPLVSIVIPSKDNVKVLFQCLDSIRAHTDYKKVEIIIIDNGSREAARRKIEEYVFAHQNMNYLYRPMEFNFSKMCNEGVKASTGEYVLLLNDDIEIVQNDWLSRMLGQAMQESAGAVSAKLYYPDTDRIQHVGVINLKEGPTHALAKARDIGIRYYGRNTLTYDWLAVTAACLLVSRKKYDEAGGLKEELQVAYNDVEFCFNLYEKGYENTVRADVVCYHHESLSRGFDGESREKTERLARERKRLFELHPALAGHDPYYNENLTQISADFTQRVDSERLADTEVTFLKRAPGKYRGSDFVIEEAFCDGVVLIRGWVSCGNTKEDTENELHILIRTGNNRLLRVECVRMPREDVAQSDITPTEARDIGFVCAVPEKYCAGTNRIGAEFSGEKTFYTWSPYGFTLDQDGTLLLEEDLKGDREERLYLLGKQRYRLLKLGKKIGRRGAKEE